MILIPVLHKLNFAVSTEIPSPELLIPLLIPFLLCFDFESQKWILRIWMQVVCLGRWFWKFYIKVLGSEIEKRGKPLQGELESRLLLWAVRHQVKHQPWITTRNLSQSCLRQAGQDSKGIYPPTFMGAAEGDFFFKNCLPALSLKIGPVHTARESPSTCLKKLSACTGKVGVQNVGVRFCSFYHIHWPGRPPGAGSILKAVAGLPAVLSRYECLVPGLSRTHKVMSKSFNLLSFFHFPQV